MKVLGRIVKWVVPSVLIAGVALLYAQGITNFDFITLGYDLVVGRNATVNYALTVGTSATIDSIRAPHARIDTVTTKIVTASQAFVATDTIQTPDSLHANTAVIDTTWAMRLVITGAISGTSATATFDSIRATGANVDTITGMRLNLSATAVIDSVEATAVNADTITTMRVVASGVVKAANVEVTSTISATGAATVDSLRATAVNTDTIHGVKMVRRGANNYFAGKVALLTGKCSTAVYIPGARVNDVVIASFQMHKDSSWSAAKTYRDSTYVMVRPETDSLRFWVGSVRAGKAAGADTIVFIRVAAP